MCLIRAIMKRTRHATYNINYHFVWCPKYRKKVLIDPLKALLDTKIKEIIEEEGWELKNLAIEPDHIHLFITVKPTICPMIVVKTIKGKTARLGKQYSNLGKRFWSPSYYVGTAGHVSAKTIQQYIENQG